MITQSLKFLTFFLLQRLRELDGMSQLFQGFAEQFGTVFAQNTEDFLRVIKKCVITWDFNLVNINLVKIFFLPNHQR